MMVVIIVRMVSKMKPNSVKIMPIVSDSKKKELSRYLQNNFDVYSRSYQDFRQ